jgi:hypothetical protein
MEVHNIEWERTRSYALDMRLFFTSVPIPASGLLGPVFEPVWP